VPYTSAAAAALRGSAPKLARAAVNMGCGASSDRRSAAAAARYGANGVQKVGLSGAAATEAKKGIRACRLFESVSEQVLTDIVTTKCAPCVVNSQHQWRVPALAPRTDHPLGFWEPHAFP
jgi:hypothetical protein